MLQRLKLKNFKKHTDTDVEFKPGLNGIIGPNYRGKTTILYGILYALGGATAVPSKNLQTNGTNTGFGVEMWFELHGTDYRVLRTKSKAELHRHLNVLNEDGTAEEMIANGTTEVNRQIAELLGMNIKRFRELKWARQGRTEAILTLGATQLFNIVSDLTGVNEVNSAIEKLDDMRKKSRGALEVLPIRDLPHLEAKKNTAVAEAFAAEAAFVKVTAQVVKTKELVTVAEENVTTLEATMAHYVETNRAFNSWKEKETELSTKVTETALVLKAAKKVVVDGDLEIKVPAWSDRADELNIASGALRTLRKSLPEVQEKADKAAAALLIQVNTAKALGEKEVKVPKGTPNVEALLSTRAECTSRIEELGRTVTALNQSLTGAVCPECERPFDNDEHDYEAWATGQKSKIDEAEKEIAYNNDTVLPKINEQLAQRRAVDKHDVELSDCNVKMTQAKVAHEEAVAALDKLQTEIAGMMTAEAIAAELAEVNEKFRAGNDALNALKTAEKRALDAYNDHVEFQAKEKPATPPKKVPIRIEEVAQAKLSLTAVKTQLTGLQEAQMEATRVSSAARNAESNAIELLETATADNEKLVAIENRLNVANTLDKYLRENRDSFTSSVWSQFMAQASMFASTCTGGAIEEIDRDEETGQFRFKENDEWLPIDDASGCQQAVMGMAVQEALSDAAKCPLDILLADEISGSMDATHSAAIMTLLASSGKQVITVSHEEIDNSFFNHVISL